MPAGTDISKPEAYYGEHRRGVDLSRRVLLPSEWRSTGCAVDFKILLWPMHGPDHLLVLPPKRWEQMLEKLGSASLTNEPAMTVQRFISAHCHPRALDSYGRLPIPDEAAKAAAITGEAVLVGLFDKFEIWSSERYQAIQQSDVTQKILSSLGELPL